MTSDEPARSPQRTRGRRLGRAAAYGLGTAVVLFGFGFVVRSKWDPIISLDDSLIASMTSVTRRSPGLHSFLDVWEVASQPLVIHAIGIALCLWVWRAKGMRTRAWWAFATLMVSWMVGIAAKEIFQRARPVVEDPVSKAPGYSFPSGHALNAAAWATTVVVLLWPLLRSVAARTAAVVLATAFIVVTALDRTFLGVHYPTDVTAGVLTGTGLVLASYAGYTGWRPSEPDDAHDPDVGPHPVADADVADDPAHDQGRPDDGLAGTTPTPSRKDR